MQEVRRADGHQPQLRLRRVQQYVLHSGEFVGNDGLTPLSEDVLLKNLYNPKPET